MGGFLGFGPTKADIKNVAKAPAMVTLNMVTASLLIEFRLIENLKTLNASTAEPRLIK